MANIIDCGAYVIHRCNIDPNKVRKMCIAKWNDTEGRECHGFTLRTDEAIYIVPDLNYIFDPCPIYKYQGDLSYPVGIKNVGKYLESKGIHDKKQLGALLEYVVLI